MGQLLHYAILDDFIQTLAVVVIL